VTTLTTEDQQAATARETRSPAYWPKIKPILLAIAFPLALLAIWHFATVNRPASLIPPPYDVWQELQDLAIGGINDDAYSRTLLRISSPR
jgi:NitT/TauT family transport system permease protein